jgi:hypothetical protein
MDMCSALVTIGHDGDKRTTVAKTGRTLISYPEVEILLTAHGERSISDLKVVKTIDADHDEEVRRLKMIYKNSMFQKVYPGARVRLPMTAPDDVPRSYENPAKKKADSEAA